MEKNQENQNEYYRSLNAKIPLADMIVQEAYNNQINIVIKQREELQKTIEEIGGVENVSFVNIAPRRGERLVRRKGFVIGLNEIYIGKRSEQLREAEIYDNEQNKIYGPVEVCENPLGYTFGFSVKFPEGKSSMVIDSEKGESIPINEKNLESKLKKQDLNPSLIKKAQTKYNYEKREEQKETVYQIFFNYAMSEKEIDDLKTIQPEDIKEIFRIGIRKPLEKAIDCIVNLELK